MNILDYLIICAYLLGLIVLGFCFQNQSGKSDYFLGARTIGWKPLSLSIMATQLSAVSFISAPAFVGLREAGGLIWLSYEIALPIAMLLLLYKVLPYLHSTGVISVYDFLEQRFGFSTRILLSVVFQISRSFATAIMIYAVSIILQGAIGLAFWQSILCIGLVTIIYSLQGGMKAVVYGDALQMLVIILGALGCLAFGLYHIGGVSNFLALVEPDRLQAVDFKSTGFDGDGFGFWPMLFGGIILYASYYGCDQSEAQRSLAAKDTQELKKMIMAASFLRFPITLIYCGAGLVIGTLALNTPEFMSQIPANNPDWMMPIFIVNYMPNGVIGLLLVAILAAAMSSLSSAINSLSAVSLEDYCRYTQTSFTAKEYMLKARLAGIFWGIVTLTLAFFAGDIAPTVIEAINKVGSVFYGPILACFVLGFATTKIGGRHVNYGLLFGVGINIILWLFVHSVFWFWYNLIGFLMTIATAYLTMLVSPTKIKLQASHTLFNTNNPLNWVNALLMLAWSRIIIVVFLQLPRWLS
ncbi:MAG: SSS family transporter [Patiriisocius sp.]|jgi:SSS family transporter